MKAAALALLALLAVGCGSSDQVEYADRIQVDGREFVCFTMSGRFGFDCEEVTR